MPAHQLDIVIRPDPQGERRAVQAYRRIDQSARRTRTSSKQLTGEFTRQTQRAGQFRREVTRLSGAMGEASRNAGGMASIMARLGLTISAFAAFSSVRGMVREFGEWELALVGVNKTTDLTKKQLADLETRSLMLARVVPIPAEEILAIAQAAGQVGVQGVDNLMNFARAIADLGLASDVGGEMAVLSLKKILDMASESDDQVRYLASGIVALGNSFPALESQIVSSTREIAKVLGRYKIASTDSAAIATALISSGVQPELSRSSLLKFFGSLNKAVLGNKRLLGEWTKLLGISKEELREIWKTDKVQLLVKVMEKFKGEGEKITLVLEKLGLAGLRLDATLPALANNVGILKDAVATSRTDVKHPEALDEEVEKFYGAFVNQMKLVSAHVGEARALFGQYLAPSLLEAAEGVKAYFAALLDGGTVAERAMALNRALGVVFNNFSRLMHYLATYIGYTLVKSFWKWISTMVTATGTTRGLSVAVARFLTIAKGLAKLVLLLVVAEGIYRLIEINREATELMKVDPGLSRADIFKVELGEMLSAVLTWNEKVHKVTITVFLEAWGYIVDVVGRLWQGAMQKISDLFVVTANSIKTAFSSVYVWILSKIHAIWAAITRPLQKLAELTEKFHDYKDQALALPSQTRVGRYFGLKRPDPTSSDTGARSLADSVQRAVDDFGLLVEKKTDLLNETSENVTAANSRLQSGGYFDNVFAGTKDAVAKAIEEGFKTNDAVKRTTIDLAGDPLRNRVDAARAAFKAGQGPLDTSAADITYPDRTEQAPAKTITEDFIDRWANALKRIKDEFRGLFTQQVPDMVAQTFTAIADGTQSVGESFKSLGYIIVKSLIETLIAAVVQAALFRAVAGTSFGNWLGVPAGGPAPGGSGGAPISGIGGASAARGGLLIPSFAAGGPVSGPGGPRDDKVLANLSHGEFVVNSRSTNRFLPLLEAINSASTNGSQGGSGGGGGGMPSIVIEDRRPPSAPRLEIEQGEVEFSQGQIQRIRLQVKEEIHQSMRRGELDRSVRANFNIRRRPTAR